MGKINRISDFIGPIKVDNTGKKLQLDGIDSDSGANFVVYGRDGAGTWRERTDASLQVAGGGGGSDFVKTSNYTTMNDAAADAAALNKPILVDSVIKQVHPDGQKRIISSVTDASVTVPFSVSGGGAAFADQNNVALFGPLDVNANPTARDICPFTGWTTFKDNILKDYSVTKTLTAGDVVDIGGGVVEFRMSGSSFTTRNDFSPGHRVRFNGSINYGDPAGYIVAENTDDWNNPARLRVFAPFVAETIPASTVTVTRGLIGVPVDGHQFEYGRAVCFQNTMTYIDDKVYWLDWGNGAYNPNEIVIEEFYQPTVFTQGQMYAARVRLPVFANGFSGANQSSQLSVTIVGSPGGVYDGTFPIKYIPTKTSGSSLILDPDYVVIEGVCPDLTSDLSLAGTITFNQTRINAGFTILSNNIRMPLSGFNEDSYDRVFRSQPNVAPNTAVINKPYVVPNNALDGNQFFTTERFTTPEVTVYFNDPSHYIVFEARCNFEINYHFVFPTIQKCFDMEVPEIKDSRQRSIVRFNFLDSVNAGHWGLTQGNDRANAPFNDPPLVASMNAAGDSGMAYILPEGAYSFSGWVVSESSDIGANVEKLGTNDIMGAGMNQTTLFLAGGTNKPIFYMNDQSWHNAIFKDITISGNNASRLNPERSANPCQHPQTPCVLTWGFNNRYFQLQVNDCTGGCHVIRQGQSNDHRALNCEWEKSPTYGLMVIGITTGSFKDCSWEACQDGLMIVPSIDDGTWFAPRSLTIEVTGCYLEANTWDISVLGVRAVYVRMIRQSPATSLQVRHRLGAWNGIGAVGCELDYASSSSARVQMDCFTRHNIINLPQDSSDLVTIEDYGDSNNFGRKGMPINQVPLTTDDSGDNFFNNTNLAIAGGASVNQPYGDGTAKWKGSGIFSDPVSFINNGTIDIPTRWQDLPTFPGVKTVPITTIVTLVDGTYYLRALFKAHPTWYIRFRVTNSAVTEVYDWRERVWVTGTTIPTGADVYIVPTNGDWQFLQWELPMNGVSRTVRWAVSYSNNSTFKDPQLAPFLWEYFDITDNKNRGLVHRRNGEDTHIGLVDQQSSVEYSTAALVKTYERQVFTDSQAGPFTLDLPENPHPGEAHRFIQRRVGASSNDVTIDGGSRNIGLKSGGTAGTITLPSINDFETLEVVYNLGNNLWIQTV